MSEQCVVVVTLQWPNCVQSVPPVQLPFVMLAPQCWLLSTGSTHAALEPLPVAHSDAGQPDWQLFDTQKSRAPTQVWPLGQFAFVEHAVVVVTLQWPAFGP